MSELTYTRVGDYLIPNLQLSDPSSAPPLGLYGTFHKEYQRENRPSLYSRLLLTERLYPLCREIDESARERLKRAGNHQREAEEMILTELVYI